MPVRHSAARPRRLSAAPTPQIRGLHPDLVRLFEAAPPKDQAFLVSAITLLLDKSDNANRNLHRYLTPEQHAAQQEPAIPIANPNAPNENASSFLVNRTDDTGRTISEWFLAPGPTSLHWTLPACLRAFRALRKHYRLTWGAVQVSLSRFHGRPDAVSLSTTRFAGPVSAHTHVSPELAAALINASDHCCTVRLPMCNATEIADATGPHRVAVQATPGTGPAKAQHLTITASQPLESMTVDDAIAATVAALRRISPAMEVFTVAISRDNAMENRGTKGRPRWTRRSDCTVYAWSGQHRAALSGAPGRLAAEAFLRWDEAHAEHVMVWTNTTPREALP